MAIGDGGERDTGAPSTPRDREIVQLLREVGRGEVGPDAETSARMRARLMASIAAPDPDTHDLDAAADEDAEDAEDAAGSAGTTHPGSPRSPRPGRRRAPRGLPPAGRSRTSARTARPGARSRVGRRARLAARATGGLGVALLLGLVLVVLSRDALPGETLYGLKRVSETAELGLTPGQEARARGHLELAEKRLAEVSGLLGRASASGAGPTAAGVGPAGSVLVADTLAEFEEETREGVSLFLPLTADPSGPAPGVLAGWARAQSDHLDAIAPSLVGATRPALESSRALLGRITVRADELAVPAVCPRTATDEWGPVPSCLPTSAAPSPGPGAVPAGTPDPSSSTSSTTTSGTTTEPDATEEETTAAAVPGAPAAPSRRPAAVPAPAPVVPAVPRAPTIDPPRLPNVPALPRVDVPPVVPGLPGLGGG